MMLRIFFSTLITVVASITVNQIPTTGTPPVRGLYSQSVYFQNKLYVFGGQNGIGEMLNELHIFHISTQIWERIEPIDGISPMGRMVFGIYASDSAIFVHGGLGTNGQLNDLWSYDAVSNTWLKIVQSGDIPPPFYRTGFTQFTHNGIIYFGIGWFGTEDLASSDDLYLYDTTTSTWRKMPKVAKTGHSVPTARRMCSLNYHNGFVYMWGGNILTNNAGAILYRYDLTTEEWELVTVTGTLPQSRTFFGSGVYNNFLYIFTGWVADWGTDVDETCRLDLTQVDAGTGVWEFLTIENVANYQTYIPRDSYASTLVSNNFYMHSGYSTLVPLGNFLIKLDLDQSPITLTEISIDADMPTNRYYSTMTVISGKFYMYGGSTGTDLLDELWAYDESDETWTLLDTGGQSPGLRQGHSAAANGNSLFIWGGKNGPNFYNDLHIYNTLTNVWELVEVKSSAQPTPQEGACMQIYNEDIYLFGGKNTFRSNNYVWKFSVGSNEWSILSEGKYNSPLALSYSTCYTAGTKMYIMYGLADDTSSPANIQIFDLETLIWEQSSLTIANKLASVASGQAGSSIIIANGSRWNNQVLTSIYVLDLDSNTIEHVSDTDQGSFAESSVYYKNSLYVFGGGASARDGAIRLTRSINRFYQINFPDLECSIGTYEHTNECLPCPQGSYKNTYGPGTCIQCPAGLYNEQVGSSSPKTCIPCPEGTFNSLLGQPFCLRCPDSTIWPTGTTTPRPRTLIDNEYKDTQPDPYESLTHLAEAFTLYVFVSIIAFLGFIVISLWFSTTLIKVVPSWDIFTDAHNHEINQVMKTRRTFIGGICTLVGVLLFWFLTIQSCLYFFYDNVDEIKALVPIVVTKDFNPIKGTINIKVTLNDYGGQCVTTESECIDEISYTKTDVTGKMSSLSCSAEDNVCIVQLTCTNCILQKTSTITFSSYEPFAYAASLQFEVSSQSSVPDHDSEIQYTLSAPYGEVFRGAEPTLFNFIAIPSVFESEVSGDTPEDTGYHLALGDSSQQGSSYTVENLSQTRFLHAQVSFSQGDSALSTKRIRRERYDTLILAIIGAIAGVFEFIAILMGKVEETYERIKRQIDYANAQRKLAVNHQLSNYFTDSQVDIFINTTNRYRKRVPRIQPFEEVDDRLNKSVMTSRLDMSSYMSASSYDGDGASQSRSKRTSRSKSLLMQDSESIWDSEAAIYPAERIKVKKTQHTYRITTNSMNDEDYI